MTNRVRPAASEYDPFYAGYISLVPETGILEALEHQPGELQRVVAAVGDREHHRYAEDKWSVRQVFGHLVDVERVVGHRAFRISRGDQAPLAGFDEADYVAASDFHERPVAALNVEFNAVRETNLMVLRRLPDSAWDRVGTANGAAVTVRALAYILVGHARHHVNVLRDRYGIHLP